MEFGPHLQRFLEIEEDTGETPASLEKKPSLPLASHNLLFLCFMTLHMMRTTNGFGPNPITLDEITGYNRSFGPPPVDFDLQVRLVKQMDEVALDWMASKRKKE